MVKTVAITGAGRGLGRYLAAKFFINDWHLVLNTRRSDLDYSAPRGVVVHGDMTDNRVYKEFMEQLRENEVDVLINNAGIYLHDFLPMFDINTYVPIELMCDCVTTIFGERSCGKIVNINSLAGLSGEANEPYYSATKHALRGFSVSMQKMLANENRNIQITDIYLGAMKTDMTKHRSDYDKLMSPRDVAKIIYDICQVDGVHVSEMTIRRIPT